MTPLLRRIVATYAILAIVAFCFPGGLKGWLDDRNNSGGLDAPLSVVRGIDAASAAVGVKGVGRWLRREFRGLIGGDDES